MVDMWISRLHIGCIGICIHFINDHWIVQKRVIIFKILDHPHPSVNMNTPFLDILRGLNIYD